MRHRGSLNVLMLLVVIQLIPLPVFAHEGQNQALVLVAASDSQIEKLQPRLFRKLFLDVPVTSNNQPLIPLINTSDDLLYEIFLQKVVYMSERHYERMLISRTFRTGRPRPARFSDNSELVKALNSTPGSVSVMWRKIAEEEKAVRIVQTLWEDRH
jgi:hypothetical protein